MKKLFNIIALIIIAYTIGTTIASGKDTELTLQLKNVLAHFKEPVALITKNRTEITTALSSCPPILQEYNQQFVLYVKIPLDTLCLNILNSGLQPVASPTDAQDPANNKLFLQAMSAEAKLTEKYKTIISQLH